MGKAAVVRRRGQEGQSLALRLLRAPALEIFEEYQSGRAESGDEADAQRRHLQPRDHEGSIQAMTVGSASVAEAIDTPDPAPPMAAAFPELTCSTAR